MIGPQQATRLALVGMLGCLTAGLISGHGSRLWAGLYLVVLARPQRPFTEAKRRAVLAAVAAKRVCDKCGPVDYIPRGGVCWDCRGYPPPDATLTGDPR